MDKIITHDESFTLFCEEYKEHYHNTNDGAKAETLKKHILPALKFHQNSQKIVALDICFGLGYNSLYLHHLAKDKQLFIYSPEKDSSLLQNLTNFIYPNDLNHKILQSIITQKSYQDANSSLELYIGNARDYLLLLKERGIKFNTIFQDAFSPNKNKELWTFEYFKSLYEITSKDCLITTYSQNSSMLYSAFLAGFYSFSLRQQDTRDSTLLCKDIAKIQAIFKDEIKPFNLSHKIKHNKNLKGLYD
ncbi:MnmC family methyltransferase [Helicobacter burdigaliensis]|uniref:MnmC family methyltransferase n=1 Tax=Helicobacter burdigaliensis TaxID=2315334 RepID=UPI000EF65B4E|nr:MnmC family methyltransferase [Helicobacter burdigaliensis]